MNDAAATRTYGPKTLLAEVGSPGPGVLAASDQPTTVLDEAGVSAYADIIAILAQSDFDLAAGFAALKNSLRVVPRSGLYRDKGESVPVKSLEDAVQCLNEAGEFELLAYRSKGSVNAFTGAPLSVKGGIGAFDPGQTPGIVISQAILQELGGGNVQQDQSHRVASIRRTYKEVLPPGSLGLVHFPDHPGVACVFADAGPFHSSGEVSVAAAREAGVLKGKSDLRYYTDYDTSVVDDYVLPRTASGRAMNQVELTPSAIRNRTRTALRARLESRASLGPLR